MFRRRQRFANLFTRWFIRVSYADILAGRIRVLHLFYLLQIHIQQWRHSCIRAELRYQRYRHDSEVSFGQHPIDCTKKSVTARYCTLQHWWLRQRGNCTVYTVEHIFHFHKYPANYFWHFRAIWSDRNVWNSFVTTAKMSSVNVLLNNTSVSRRFAQNAFLIQKMRLPKCMH